MPGNRNTTLKIRTIWSSSNQQSFTMRSLDNPAAVPRVHSLFSRASEGASSYPSDFRDRCSYNSSTIGSEFPNGSRVPIVGQVFHTDHRLSTHNPNRTNAETFRAVGHVAEYVFDSRGRRTSCGCLLSDASSAACRPAEMVMGLTIVLAAEVCALTDSHRSILVAVRYIYSFMPSSDSVPSP